MTTPPGEQPPHGGSEQPGGPEQPGAGWQQQPPGGPWPQGGQPWQQGGPWQQPPPGYPAPPGYGYGYPMAPPDHPKAMSALIVGIIGLVMCQVASPFAWAIGKKTMTEIDASGGRLGGRGQAQAGYILGIIGSVLLGLGLLFLLGYLVLFIAVIGGGAVTS